jgi:hypothetical protein
MLEQLLALSKSMDKSLKQTTEILRNGQAMLEHDERSLRQQGEILATLKAAIEQRDRLLRESQQNKQDGH